MTSPVLKVSEANKPFIVHSDASDVGLGAVLSQVGEWMVKNNPLPTLAENESQEKLNTLPLRRNALPQCGL